MAEPDLNDVMAFTRVVDAGSFSAAARNLNLPTSTVSRRVARLEENLGLRLLQRTTRKLHLTEVGELYYDRARNAVRDLEDAEQAVRARQLVPRGKLRVTLPSDLSAQWFDLFDEFLAAFPEVNLELFHTERAVDLIQEGFDVAIRGGPKPESATYIVRKLIDTSRKLVASPEYLRARGTPTHPKELTSHDCVLFEPWTHTGMWTLYQKKRAIQVRVSGRLMTNDLGTVRDAAVSGLGVAILLASHCAADLSRGSLVEVLEGSCGPTGAVWLVYPSRRHMLPTVRAFVDHVSARFDGTFVPRASERS
ncbi:MAG: LysR family transcriptional regulator [Myxococcota bacterium]